MASSRLQDAARTLTGLAMVAREAATTSRTLNHHHHHHHPLRSSSSSPSASDFSAFLSSSLSRLLLSAGDLLGITRGTPRSPPPALDPHENERLRPSPADPSPPPPPETSVLLKAIEREEEDFEAPHSIPQNVPSPNISDTVSKSSSVSSSANEIVLPSERHHGKEEVILAKGMYESSI